MDLSAKELIELTKEIDEKCIDFAEWLSKETQKRIGVDLYWYNGSLHKIKQLLEIYKKEKGL